MSTKTRTVSLYSAARGSNVRELFPTRDAAVRAVLAHGFAVRAAYDRGDNLDAMIENAHAEVDELTGTFRGKTESRYFCVPVRVSEEWTPGGLLDVPATFAAVWSAETDSVSTRLMALQMAAYCNAMRPKHNWWVVLEIGDELPSDGYEVRVQDGVGVASRVTSYPLRVVRPSERERDAVFASLDESVAVA